MTPTKKMPAGMRPRDGQINSIAMAVYVPRDAAFFKADLAINHKDDGDARNDTQSNN